jgi:hypothetical protein
LLFNSSMAVPHSSDFPFIVEKPEAIQFTARDRKIMAVAPPDRDPNTRLAGWVFGVGYPENPSEVRNNFVAQTAEAKLTEALKNCGDRINLVAVAGMFLNQSNDQCHQGWNMHLDPNHTLE